MKILCETQVINRQMPQTSNSRAVKSTLAIGLHPPNKENSELFIIHFTPQNKTGYRYKIKNNIEKVFTKFMNDGKATISFKTPEHNLQIKCDPIQLKCFLRTMKLALDNKTDMRKIGLTTLATTAVAQKSHPITKLFISKASDYPIKGLPKTLKELHITMNCHRVDSQIINLKNLTKLNLNENRIRCIPKQLGELGLTELIMSSNRLGNEGDNDCSSMSHTQKWAWLDGKRIRKTLKSLDLSNNDLKYFPYNLVRLDNLVVLKLNDNEIKKIPFAVRRLTNLRFFHLNSNKLESMPHTISYMKLETLDLWNNNFRPLSDLEAAKRMFDSSRNKIQPLWVLSGQVVLRKRIPYSASTIPLVLVDFLSEMPLCYCGNLCFFDVDQIMQRIDFLNLNNIRGSFCSDRSSCVYADSIFCTEECFKKNCSRLIAFPN